MYIYNPIIKTNNNRNDYRQLTKDSHLVEDSQSVLYSHSVIYNQTEGSNHLVENNYSVNYSHLVEDNDLIERKEIPVIEGTGEILQDTSSTGRIRNWSEKKEMNLELVELLKEFRMEYPELLTSTRLIQIEDCATELKYGKLEEGKKRLIGANFCRFKLCPICVWRKSLKLFGQVSAVAEKLNKEYPSGRYIFATFTVKNVRAEELSDAIDKLNEGFKRLVQKNKTMAEAKVFQSSLLGYLKCLEITYNKKTHEYHPHIHVVFHLKSSYFGKNYISHNKWVSIWKSMMNLDYNPEVNIRMIKKEYLNNSNLIGEIAKYPIKTSDILNIKDRDEQIEVLHALLSNTHHRRFVTFGGIFRATKRELALDDIETGNLLHIESESSRLNYIAYELYKYDFKFGCCIC